MTLVPAALPPGWTTVTAGEIYIPPQASPEWVLVGHADDQSDAVRMFAHVESRKYAVRTTVMVHLSSDAFGDWPTFDTPEAAVAYWELTK